MGDHTETLQLDFDPTQISYTQLLELFWQSHTPARKAWKRQYMSAIFVHNAEQQALAEASKAKLVGDVHTPILPASTFYMAEDYHQKFTLQQKGVILAEFRQIYPEMNDFVRSTAVARVNGYLSGYAQLSLVQETLPQIGLSEQTNEQILSTVRYYK